MIYLVILWIVMIAYLSFVNGKHTLASSQKLYQYLPINMYLIRDLAHIVEFLVLTILVLQAKQSIWIVWIVNLLSEGLKPFVTKGRHFHLDDLGYNTIGMILGWLVIKYLF